MQGTELGIHLAPFLYSFLHLWVVLFVGESVENRNRRKLVSLLASGGT